MVYRLPVSDPSAAHIALFAQAMTRASWYCWHYQISRRTPARAQLFLPWHRAYLWWLEQALQDLVSGVALPWWDWTTDPGIPAAYAAPKVGSERNPLRSTTASVPSAVPPINRKTRRAPGSNPLGRLPRPEDLESGDPNQPGVLELQDWSRFSDGLENLHDGVHEWVSGDMGDQTTAAYDPIFFAHHCMVDRVWHLWQIRHGNSGIPSELLALPLAPFGKTVRDVLDVQTLGYEYAASVTSIPIPQGGAKHD